MWTLGIEKKPWFKAAKDALERKGLTIIIQKQSIITNSSLLKVPHVINSERDFIDYAILYGAKIDAKYAAASEEPHRAGPQAAWERPRSRQPDRPSSDGDISPLSPDAAEQDDLPATIQRLRAAGKTVIAQRNAWQQRALEAEARVQALTVTLGQMRESGSNDKRFDELRRFLAREFHPDHSKTDGIEKIIRAEIFKAIWPRVEEIAKAKI